MRQVVSASRRTDIPAFYLGWLIEGLERGEVWVANPFSGKPYRVDLRPEAVHSLVLWSKDFGPFLRCREAFSSYHLYFHFTVTGLPRRLEPRAPAAEEAVAQAGRLVELYGPEVLVWRFDPLLFFTGVEERVETFGRLARAMRRAGVRRATLGFFRPYPKALRRMEGVSFRLPSAEEKEEVARRLLSLAREEGISLALCSAPRLRERVTGFSPEACIDGRLLSRIFGEPCPLSRHPGQQEGCACSISRDVGGYESMPCSHGCLYCYAYPVGDLKSGSPRFRSHAGRVTPAGMPAEASPSAPPSQGSRGGGD